MVRRLSPLLVVLLLSPGSVRAACADWTGAPRVTEVRAQAGAVTALAAAGEQLLAGLATGAVKLYDLADADRPYLRDALTLDGAPVALAPADTLVAALLADPGRLRLLTRTADTLADAGGVLSLPGRPVDAAWLGHRLYALCVDAGASPPASWLVTVDAADPATPAAVDVRQVPHPAAALDLRPGLLAVAGPAEPNLQLLDLTDPATPVPLATWNAGGLLRDVLLHGDDAVLAGADGLWTLDLADPAQPALRHAVPAVPGWSRVARVDGLNALLRTDAQGGMEGLSLLDAADGAPLAALALRGETLAAARGRIYVGRGQELVVLAPGAAASPSPMAALAPDAADDAVTAVARAGARAAAAVRTAAGTDLWLLDTDPLLRRATFGLPGAPSCLALSGGLAAVGVDAGGVHLVDVADPDAPALIGTFTLPGVPAAVAFRGRILDVLVRATDAAVTDRWLCWSLEEPSAPVPGYATYLPGAPAAILHDPTAATAVVAGLEFCDLFDLSEPLRPVLAVDHIVGAEFTALARDDAGRTWAALGGGLLVRLAGLEQGAFQLLDSVWLPDDAAVLLPLGDRLWAAGADLAVYDLPAAGAPVLLGQAGAGAASGAALGDAGILTAAGPLGLLELPPPCVQVGTEPAPDPAAPPSALRLDRPYPNPFNPQVSLPFALTRPGDVRLEILDAAGRRVAAPWRGPRTAGEHVVVWDGRDEAGRAVPSGVYLVRLRLGDELRTRKLELLR